MIRLKYIIVFLLILSDISGQQKDYLEKKRKETLKEIENTQSILNEVSKSKINSVEKLKLLESQIINRNTLIGNLSNEIEFSDNEITEQQILINAIEYDVEIIKKIYARMIFVAYKKHKKGNFITYIISAQSFDQAYKRLKYIKQYSFFRKKQLATINEIRENLSKKKVMLEVSKKTKQKLLKSKEKEIIQLGSEKNSQKTEFEKLKKKEASLKRELEEKVRIANKLQKEVENLILSERERRKTIVAKSLNEMNIVSGNFKENRGRLPWPTEKGVIVNTFGEQEHPILKGVKVRNNGIDISTYSNAKVFSIFEGEVKKVFSILGANYTIIIRHGEFLTVYQNLVNVRVKPGDKIKAKQEIGALYSDISSNSSILHLEIWEEANKLNPQIWLGKN